MGSSVWSAACYKLQLVISLSRRSRSQRVNGMGDRDTLRRLAWALLLTLPMVVGVAAADGDVRLIEAARKQDWQKVRTLLNQHADVNVPSEDGSTAPLWA